MEAYVHPISVQFSYFSRDRISINLPSPSSVAEAFAQLLKQVDLRRVRRRQRPAAEVDFAQNQCDTGATWLTCELSLMGQRRKWRHC
jgi:hypothetical protein